MLCYVPFSPCQNCIEPQERSHNKSIRYVVVIIHEYIIKKVYNIYKKGEKRHFISDIHDINGKDFSQEVSARGFSISSEGRSLAPMHG